MARVFDLMKFADRFRRFAWLAVPVMLVLAADALLRREALYYFNVRERVAYALTALGSVLLWSDLLQACAGQARRISKRVIFFVFVFIVVGAQAYTYAKYRAYVGPQGVLSGSQFFPSWGEALRYDARHALPALLAVLLIGVGGPLYATRILGRKYQAKLPDRALVVALIAFFISPARFGVGGETPDVLALNAVGQLSRAMWAHDETVHRVHPGARHPNPVPELSPRGQPPQRNVLFLLTESVRAQSYCVDPHAPCIYTPFTHEALKERLPLLSMRALDSTTAISISVLWSGLLPNATREETHSAPLVWDYAHAAGYQTAYFTSQNVLFGNMGRWLGSTHFDHVLYATDLDPAPSLDTGASDAVLAERSELELRELPEPFFAVVHFSNTHYPYEIDSKDPPFMPQSMEASADKTEQLRNRYQDAIYMQDRAIARMLTAFEKTERGANTVVMFISDHGEQLNEHGGNGHTGTVYEEEIRVPAWVLAPGKTLTLTERNELQARRSTPVTQADILPTTLDLMGIYDTRELAPFRAMMRGSSLLRPAPAEPPILPLANCTELWACTFRSAGVIQGNRKLIAHQGTGGWQCFDAAADPTEAHPLPWPGCADLVAHADTVGKPFAPAQP